MITNPHAISKAFRVTRKRSVSRYFLSLRSPWRTMVTPVKVRNTWFPVKSAKHLEYFDIKLVASKIYEWSELILCLLTGRGSLVDASGYTFTDKDTKPGKIKVKKTSKASTKKKADGTAP